jgi:hypothetical protein
MFAKEQSLLFERELSVLMSVSKNQTKQDLMIQVWEQLDCESVGAKELISIQQALLERFGAGAVDSPAAIARVLADEGAVLRHPEVLECDAAWREAGFAACPIPREISFENLEVAALSIKKVDEIRQDLEAEARKLESARLRQEVTAFREERLLVARSAVVSERVRLEAAEIVEWLDVWLKTPDFFADWLELRRRSAEFESRFRS